MENVNKNQKKFKKELYQEYKYFQIKKKNKKINIKRRNLNFQKLKKKKKSFISFYNTTKIMLLQKFPNRIKSIYD